MMTLLLLTSALASPINWRCPCDRLLPPLATSASSPASSLLSPARTNPLRWSAAHRAESSCVPCGSRFERSVPEKRVGSCVGRPAGQSEASRERQSGRAHLRHEREPRADRVEVGVGQGAPVDVDRAVRGQDEAQQGERCRQFRWSVEAALPPSSDRNSQSVLLPQPDGPTMPICRDDEEVSGVSWAGQADDAPSRPARFACSARAAHPRRLQRTWPRTYQTATKVRQRCPEGREEDASALTSMRPESGQCAGGSLRSLCGSSISTSVLYWMMR